MQHMRVRSPTAWISMPRAEMRVVRRRTRRLQRVAMKPEVTLLRPSLRAAAMRSMLRPVQGFPPAAMTAERRGPRRATAYFMQPPDRHVYDVTLGGCFIRHLPFGGARTESEQAAELQRGHSALPTFHRLPYRAERRVYLKCEIEYGGERAGPWPQVTRRRVRVPAVANGLLQPGAE